MIEKNKFLFEKFTSKFVFQNLQANLSSKIYKQILIFEKFILY